MQENIYMLERLCKCQRLYDYATKKGWTIVLTYGRNAEILTAFITLVHKAKDYEVININRMDASKRLEFNLTNN